MIKRFELRGWHVLTMMLSFFGAVIAVNVVFAVLAFDSFPGEDVRRSYLQGLSYNETLAERQAQHARGWRATAALSPGVGGAELAVQLTDANGLAVEGAVFDAALQRQTDARYDVALTFTETAPGLYVATLGSLAPGQWRLRARAEAGGAPFEFEAELTWRR